MLFKIHNNSNIRFSIPAFLLILLISFVVPGAIFASHGPEHVPTFENPLSVNSFTDLLTLILNNIVLPIGAVLAVFFLIFSGFLFVTARGNEEKLATAKKSFLWTIVGIAVLLGALAISTGIQNTICQIAPNVPGICNSTSP